MNPFQSDYTERLLEWKNLRLITKGKPTLDACVMVDKWWQQAPLINHHLHPFDSDNWPDPWAILSENIYCTLTRAVGICYTLLLSDFNNLLLCQASDMYGDQYNLVMVNNAKYIMNYHPDTVLSNKLDDFKIIRELSLSSLYKNI